MRDGSFWSKSNLPLAKLLELAMAWANNMLMAEAEVWCEVSEKSVLQWFQFFRDVCSHELTTNPIQIGGPGVVVQIDETLMARRKDHRGRVVQQRWVFGGSCPTTKKGFLILVPDRTAATLLPLIQEHIAPGSVIHSDMWAAYNGIDQLPVNPPYTHHTVNHTENFVDPATGADTNHVENMWKNAKMKFKSMAGVAENTLESHLDEFMWRLDHEKRGEEAFRALLNHISVWFPTP